MMPHLEHMEPIVGTAIAVAAVDRTVICLGLRVYPLEVPSSQQLITRTARSWARFHSDTRRRLSHRVMAAAVHDTLAAGKAALGIDDRDLDPDARGAEAALFLAHVLCDFEAVGERRS